MLSGLCEAIDARPYMEGHGSRVSRLAETIALRLGWGAGRIRRLRIGALLHDVGKLAIADTIWDKAERLRSEERRVGKECSLLCRSRWSPYH